ncbi:hypothetical protein HBI60_091360 [Parastagonospora nodorum]|nr:hypothetical protein HBI60_091360 [Parastagonospora nodorum]
MALKTHTIPSPSTTATNHQRIFTPFPSPNSLTCHINGSRSASHTRGTSGTSTGSSAALWKGVGICGEELEEADVRVGRGEEDGAAGLDEGWGGDGVGFEGHGGWMFGVVEMVEEVVVVVEV